MKMYEAVIIKYRSKVQEPYQYTVVTALHTETLADISIKLDEIRDKAKDSGDDSEYKVFFAVN